MKNSISNLITAIIGLPGYIVFSMLGDMIGGLIMLIGAIVTSIALICTGHWVLAVTPILGWAVLMSAAYELNRLLICRRRR